MFFAAWYLEEVVGVTAVEEEVAAGVGIVVRPSRQGGNLGWVEGKRLEEEFCDGRGGKWRWYGMNYTDCVIVDRLVLPRARQALP